LVTSRRRYRPAAYGIRGKISFMKIGGGTRSGLALSIVLACVAGCSSTNPGKGTPASDSTGDSTASAGPTTSTPKPKVDPGLSPSAYRAKLAAAGRPLNSALAAIPKARALTVLGARVGQAERATARAVTVLGGIDAPAAVRSEHAAVVASLRRLSTELGTLSTEAHGQQLCAASSVLSSFGRMAGPGALSHTIHELAVKGYRLRVSIPTTPAHGTPRPATGTYLRSGDRSGNGQLTVQNGSTTDAVITLAVGSHARFSVFIRHGATYKVTSINDGRYAVYYASGADWDSTSGSFARECAFDKFDKPMAFTTTPVAGGIEYSTWSITLQPVIGGNASTSKVDPSNYPH
jgi:hypothetical protein